MLQLLPQTYRIFISEKPLETLEYILDFCFHIRYNFYSALSSLRTENWATFIKTGSIFNSLDWEFASKKNLESIKNEGRVRGIANVE